MKGAARFYASRDLARPPRREDVTPDPEVVAVLRLSPWRRALGRLLLFAARRARLLPAALKRASGRGRAQASGRLHSGTGGADSGCGGCGLRWWCAASGGRRRSGGGFGLGDGVGKRGRAAFFLRLAARARIWAARAVDLAWWREALLRFCALSRKRAGGQGSLIPGAVEVSGSLRPADLGLAGPWRGSSTAWWLGTRSLTAPVPIWCSGSCLQQSVVLVLAAASGVGVWWSAARSHA